MRYSILVLCAFCMGCKSATAVERMGLTMSTYSATPVVLTHFAIERPLGEVFPEAIGGLADVSLPRTGSVRALGAPIDVGNDGLWHLSARWIELPTDRAWQAEVDIPIEKLTISGRAIPSYELGVIFGPNGLLLIVSDKIGNKASDQVDVVRTCGVRVPSDDKALRLETGRFPQLKYLMKNVPPISNPECPNPQE